MAYDSVSFISTLMLSKCIEYSGNKYINRARPINSDKVGEMVYHNVFILCLNTGS